MANDHYSKQNFLIAHFPTWFFIIGYPVFWIELYGGKTGDGRTSTLATVLLLGMALWMIFSHWKAWGSILKKILEGLHALGRNARILVGIGGFLTASILGFSLAASSLPPHLVQESDVFIYHLTVPRQHLILGSFRHIPWSASDLFLLPINFALAPFWFATSLPNKIPQFIFVLGLILVSTRLVYRLSNRNLLSSMAVIYFIVGTHGIGIQLGTAMLDLVLAYLFLAALDSFLNRRIGFAVVESAFYFWSKSFIPVQMVALIAALGVVYIFLRMMKFERIRFGFVDILSFEEQRNLFRQLRRGAVGFLLISNVVAGPFLAKSLYYAGTLLFPLGTGRIMVHKDIDTSSAHWQSILASAEFFMNQGKDQYGYGRDLPAFLKHFWFMAVPTEGVNNRFDYPVGLPFLLVVGPFLYLFFRSLHRKEFSLISWFIVLYWCTWWFGSQQSRFLYIPIILMYVVVLSEVRSVSAILWGSVGVALSLNALSIYRAHKMDFGKPFEEILRQKDVRLIEMSKKYKESGRMDAVELPYGDVAYAQFPVKVTQEYLPHILTYEEKFFQEGKSE